MQALYTLFERPEPVSRLGCWRPKVVGYDQVIGLSALGLFFLRSTSDQTYAILHPLRGGLRTYDSYSSQADFERQVLNDPTFVESYLLPKTIVTLSEILGPLGYHRVYIPQPYPLLGGSGKLETYGEGDAWVFADLVGQAWGLRT